MMQIFVFLNTSVKCYFQLFIEIVKLSVESLLETSWVSRCFQCDMFQRSDIVIIAKTYEVGLKFKK